MRIDLNKIAKQLLNKYLVILFSVFVVSVISGFGLTNFKLDASSDALVLENDESLKARKTLAKELEGFDYDHAIRILKEKKNKDFVVVKVLK